LFVVPLLVPNCGPRIFFFFFPSCSLSYLKPGPRVNPPFSRVTFFPRGFFGFFFSVSCRKVLNPGPLNVLACLFPPRFFLFVVLLPTFFSSSFTCPRPLPGALDGLRGVRLPLFTIRFFFFFAFSPASLFLRAVFPFFFI